MKKLLLSIPTVAMLFSSTLMSADVTASGTYPAFKFSSTNFDGGTYDGEEWRLFTYISNDGATNQFRLVDALNTYTYPIEIKSSANNEYSFKVNSSGDVNLANGSVFIDRSANRMGIGTVSPTASLEIAGGTSGNDGDIIMKRGTKSWEFDHNGDWLNFWGTNMVATLNGTAPAYSFYMIANGNIGMGTFSPSAKLDVRGNIKATWSGSNTVNDGVKVLTQLSANNSASGKVSDAGFRLENTKEGFQWDFRTLETAQGFTATKVGTHGPEFRVDNTTSDYHNAKVSMGGVVVFENGQLQTPSSRVLKTNIKPLDTKAAIEAFHQLQPVSYAYKAHKEEPVVGFIAEDVPELVATKTRTGIDSTEIVAVLTKVVQEQDRSLKETRAELKKAQEKIAQLEKMQKRLAKVESLLTNLALDTSTSNSKKEKLSLQTEQ